MVVVVMDKDEELIEELREWIRNLREATADLSVKMDKTIDLTEKEKHNGRK